MKCQRCSKTLRPYEVAQPMVVFGRPIRPASFCDECCRASLWRGGSTESLKRLVRGEVDEKERVRLTAELEPIRASIRGALAQARQTAKTSGFEIPESLR